MTLRPREVWEIQSVPAVNGGTCRDIVVLTQLNSCAAHHLIQLCAGVLVSLLHLRQWKPLRHRTHIKTL